MPRLEGFVGPTNVSSSTNLDAEKCMNLYYEPGEIQAAKNKAMLLGTPGIVLLGTLPTAPVRGLFAGGAPLTTGGRLFAVGGSKLYEVFSDGTSLLRGDVGDDTNHSPARMYANGTTLMIVSAGYVYIDDGTAAGPVQASYGSAAGTCNTTGASKLVVWTTGDKFDDLTIGSTIVITGATYTVASKFDNQHVYLTTTPADQLGAAFTAIRPVRATTGAFLDGYYIAAQPDAKQFNLSGITGGGISWNPLQFGVKTAYPDNIGGILVDHEELWLFGSEVTEVWRNTGNGIGGFPFERDPGAVIHQGIAAPFSAASLANGVVWIGGDTRGQPVAWRAQGYQPIRISTHAVEAAWSGYATVADANAFTYTEQGHQFWVINFLSGNATWVYDATVGLWHERGFWNGSANTRQLQNSHCFVFGKHLVGSYTSGIIYQQSLATYTDNSTPIHRVRAAPHLSSDDKRSFYSRFRLDAQAGALVPTLDWSNDDGVTFINARTATPQASTGLAIYEWRRLGKARDRVFRVTTSAAVKVALIDAFVDVSAGAS